MYYHDFVGKRNVLSGRPSIRPSVRYTHSLSLVNGFQFKPATNIHHVTWILLIRFSMSEVKSQGHDQKSYLIMAEACISTL